jgi:hypothetical protein
MTAPSGPHPVTQFGVSVQVGDHFSVGAKLQDRVNLGHRLGFHVYGTYCLGTPEETWETVEKTWRFANEIDIESGFTVITPFPGTPIYWRALREGLLPRQMQFSNWNSYTSTMRTYPLTTTDLNMARRWARMETIIPYRKKRAKAEGSAPCCPRPARRGPPHGFQCKEHPWRGDWPRCGLLRILCEIVRTSSKS